MNAFTRPDYRRFARSAALEWDKRGYHARSTVTLLPSVSAAVRAAPLTSTPSTVAIGSESVDCGFGFGVEEVGAVHVEDDVDGFAHLGLGLAIELCYQRLFAGGKVHLHVI